MKSFKFPKKIAVNVSSTDKVGDKVITSSGTSIELVMYESQFKDGHYSIMAKMGIQTTTAYQVNSNPNRSLLGLKPASATFEAKSSAPLFIKITPADLPAGFKFNKASAEKFMATIASRIKEGKLFVKVTKSLKLPKSFIESLDRLVEKGTISLARKQEIIEGKQLAFVGKDGLEKVFFEGFPCFNIYSFAASKNGAKVYTDLRPDQLDEMEQAKSHEDEQMAESFLETASEGQDEDLF